MATEERVLEGEAMSRWFYVELHCQGIPADELEGQLDSIMEALVEEPGEVDADLSAELGAGTIDFQVSVQATEAGEALSLAQAFVRSALHGVGVSTPGWEHLTEMVDRGDSVATVRPSD
jgi:hypothetical protein